MTISERIFDILDKKELKSSQLATAINVNKSVVSSWKTRNSTPSAELLIDICKYLDVSIYYLLSGMEQLENIEFNSNEVSLVKNYRLLNTDDQEDVYDFIKLKVNKRGNIAESSSSKIG